MIFHKISDGIYVIENFLDESIASAVIDYANKATDNENWLYNSSNAYDFWYGKMLEMPKEIMHLLFENINNLFISNSGIVPMAAICRYLAGDAIGSHTDHHLDDDNVKYGAVVYFNDNYSGGEIVYPEVNVIIKPKARSLVIHSGDLLHHTLPVEGGGVRYFSTSFIRGTEQEPVILNPDIGQL